MNRVRMWVAPLAAAAMLTATACGGASDRPGPEKADAQSAERPQESAAPEAPPPPSAGQTAEGTGHLSTSASGEAAPPKTPTAPSPAPSAVEQVPAAPASKPESPLSPPTSQGRGDTRSPGETAAGGSPAADAAAAPKAPEPSAEAPPPAAPQAKPGGQASAGVDDAGGVVEVAATKAGLTRVGANGCKLCHKAQFVSWSETAHAKRQPPLDCEGCHGPGSEYKAMEIMKDREKAKAAGMVIPGREFCSQCHKRGWTDDLPRRAHAHKPS